MKVNISISENERNTVILGPSQVAFATKIVEPLGLMEGSLSRDLMVGAIAYVMSLDKYKQTEVKTMFVNSLKASIVSNKVIIDRALDALSEDVKLPE